MGLDLKGPRGPLLVLIAVGAVALVAAIVGVVLLAAGGGDAEARARSSTRASSEPAQFDSLDNVYNEESFTCGSTDSRCVREVSRQGHGRLRPARHRSGSWRGSSRSKVEPSVNDHEWPTRRPRDRQGLRLELQGLRLCPITFNYGCSHGFFEYVLARTRRPEGRDDDLRVAAPEGHVPDRRLHLLPRRGARDHDGRGVQRAELAQGL